MLWRNYAFKRDILASQKTSVKVATSSWRNDLNLCKEANEVLLFHGTKSNVTNFIIHQGFEPRIAKDEGLFGAGIYFAENSSKSDEYITPDLQNLCYLFLCRVAIGHPFTTTEPLKIRRPPCRKGDIGLCLHDRADSVLAECERTGLPNVTHYLKRYREFVVYDGSQCYPEFLITFQRVHTQNPQAF